MSTLFRQFSFTPETLKEVSDAVKAGASVAVTPRYPSGDGTTEVHGCILGKGKDQRVWVSQQLFDALHPDTQKASEP